jgi:chlorophyll synthase
LPILIGPDRAAQVACATIAAPQFAAIALPISCGQVVEAGIIVLLLIGQLVMMLRCLRAPVADAVWYSGFGVPLFVLGMMASAGAIRVFAAA